MSRPRFQAASDNCLGQPESPRKGKPPPCRRLAENRAAAPFSAKRQPEKPYGLLPEAA
ncbi:hypothetical protein [Kingella oralis]|uniref:hypothetical protein n=1 Tax=Kingella oralis TaxID=505 RepID=UPI002D7F9D4A|nr:hypothetical protein [Kingella oralis]